MPSPRLRLTPREDLIQKVNQLNLLLNDHLSILACSDILPNKERLDASIKNIVANVTQINLQLD